MCGGCYIPVMCGDCYIPVMCGDCCIPVMCGDGYIPVMCGDCYIPVLCGDWKKEGNVLFNEALTTFYLRLYGVRHMVEDHSYSKKGNPLAPYRQGFFYMHYSTDWIRHTTAFVTPVTEHWLEREIAHWVHHEGSIGRPIAPCMEIVI